MVWSCFYCTYDNDNDATTQCDLCGMPGNRVSKNKNKNKAEKDGKAKAAQTNAADVVDLTTTSPRNGRNQPRQRPVLDLASTGSDPLLPSRKRKAPFGNGSQSNPSESRTKSPKLEACVSNRVSVLGRRQPPKPPKRREPQPQASQRQSTLPFSSQSGDSSSPFSHGHVFCHTLRKAEPAIGDTEVRRVLRTVFGLESLRPNLQPLAIRCALEGKSQMVVLATGGGKSLCYQLPACLLGGVTVVISPLLALMKDQVEALLQKGIPAACINSSQTEKENKAILERLVPALYPRSLGRGTAATKKTEGGGGGSSKNNRIENENVAVALAQPAVLLYVTPESIQTERMRAVLKTLYKEQRLTLFAVDEAHCLSSWVRFAPRSSFLLLLVVLCCAVCGCDCDCDCDRL